MRALRLAAGGAALLTFCLIVLGAWVRATGSGLSCPDWPTCYGHWLPLPGEIPPSVGYSYAQVMLEWLHRLIAGVILGPLILLIALVAAQIVSGLLVSRERFVEDEVPSPRPRVPA